MPWKSVGSFPTPTHLVLGIEYEPKDNRIPIHSKTWLRKEKGSGSVCDSGIMESGKGV